MDEQIEHIDRRLHAILSRISFAHYLNPINIGSAYRKFLEGSSAPPFQYRPFSEAGEIQKELQSLSPPEDHPFGVLLRTKIEHILLFIKALQERTSESFDELARAQCWYPTIESIKQQFPQRQRAFQTTNIRAYELKAFLHSALEKRNETGWSIDLTSQMSARVLVQSAQKKILIQEEALFEPQDVPRLILHEIDVHAVRSSNGAQQRLHMFQTGLPFSISTEEGLAMVAEQKAGLLGANTLYEQSQLIWAIDKAKELGFRDLYEQLKIRVGPHMSWAICLRIKRGLAKPEKPGVYAKDSIYLSGWQKVSHWLAQGGDISLLYVGSVGIEHPVQEWIDNGWIHSQPVPLFWMNSTN